MGNFHDPKLVASETLVVNKLWHALAGVYIWEFVTTLNYEWSIIRRHRPYQWTIWIYSLTRVTVLAAIIILTLMQNVTTPIDCQAATTLQLIFACTGFTAASFLVVLRIIAIWKKEKIISGIAVSLWLNNTAFFIRCIVKIRCVWAPDVSTCVVINIEDSKPTVLVSTLTDIVLLIIMFVGLFNLRHEGYGTLGLTGLLWKQGVIWLSLAITLEIPSAVLIILNLNYPLNFISQPPTGAAMTIAATRMYRSLTDFSSDMTDSNIQPTTLTQMHVFHLPYEPKKDGERYVPPNVQMVTRDLERSSDT